MPQPLPIFEDHGKKYQADACQPLVDGIEGGQLRMEALVHGHYPGRKLPANALQGVKSIGYWDADHDQDWALAWHRNEGLELTFLESGSLGFAVDGEIYPLEPDDFTVTRPWQSHCVGSPNVTASRLHWIILDVGVRRPDQTWHWPSWLVLAKDDLDELTNILRHNEHPVWHMTANIRQCVQQIARAVEEDREGTRVSRLTVQLCELFLLLLEMFRTHDVPLDNTLSDVRRTVDLFLTDLDGNLALLGQEWTIRRMAASCGLGVTQFVHYCKQLTNMTPVKYLNHYRLETAAKLLLQDRNVTVTEIARTCGFSTSQYFATVFQRRFHRSPSDFRITEASPHEPPPKPKLVPRR